ncbi:hypothetical protein U9M48_044531 [Paspalum notatum var. saurae]|uniref:Peptidase A1 domain-containing protein n=1 Tax=Paspalum notatum var. saurae TaxID=547442 RepID=A0AAQ3UX37_PASNO
MSSLVLGLSHVRSLYTPSMTILNSTNNYDFLDIIEPVTAYTDGYLLSLNLGAPPQVLQVYLDTGSDLTWVPCGSTSYQCIDCGDEHKPTPTFLPSQSSSSTTDLCGSRFCVDVHSSDNRFDPCAAAGCAIPAFTGGLCSRPCPPFSYTYGGGALVLGSLARDSVTLHGSIHDGGGGGSTAPAPRPVDFPGFCFGCVGSSVREPIGIAGFGRGTLSLPSQLGFLGKGFSHCFLGFRYARNPNVSSPLVMGDLALSAAAADGGFLFTPMLRSATYPNFYYVGLEGVGVGNGTAAAAPPSLSGVDAEGNGGVLVDTGTTYTHLPDPFYASVLEALGSAAPYERARDVEARTGFGLCLRVPCARAPCADDQLPPVSLRLRGGATLTLPKQSTYYAVTAPRDSVVVKCLLFQRMDDAGGGGGASGGPAAVLGSFQMQNVEVVYDLVAGRVGFRPRDCALGAA